jgi:hypothetical protein
MEIKSLSIFSIIFLFALYSNIYCLGEDNMKSSFFNLTSKFSLERTKKIIIETLPFIKDKPYKKIELIDKKSIVLVIAELKHAEEIGGIDTWCEYRIEFYDEHSNIFELEFYGRQDFSFVRYRSKEEKVSKDYLISKKLYFLLASKVSSKTNDK